MLTQIEQDMEDNLYEILKRGEVGKQIIAKYKYQSIEELADTMTDGFKMSWVGDIVRHLNAHGGVPNFEAMYNAAFRAAMLRLLKEAKVKNENWVD